MCDSIDDKTKIQILLSLHQNLRNNQDFYMNQKWITTYFSGLIYAALYFVAKEGNRCIAYLALVSAIVSVFIICRLLCTHEESLHGERKADTKFKDDKLIKDAYIIMYPGEQDHSKSTLIHYTHVFVNIMGFLLAASLILNKLYPNAF